MDSIPSSLISKFKFDSAEGMFGRAKTNLFDIYERERENMNAHRPILVLQSSVIHGTVPGSVDS